MKYRLIDTPGFPVKHVSEMKDGDGYVVYIRGNGLPIMTDLIGYDMARSDIYNPTGLVARAFEVVQDEWTYSAADAWGDGPIWIVRQNGQNRAHMWPEQAAAEYCKWKNGGNDGK